MVAIAPKDTAPSPQPTTGFNIYQQQSGATGTTSSFTMAPGSTQSFPQTYTGATYPGISEKTLGLYLPTASAPEIPELAGNLNPAVAFGGYPDGYNPEAAPQTVRELMDILLQRAGTDPNAIAQLQDQLILGGYLDPRDKSYTPGGVVQPGDATWDAYSHLLMDAVRSKTPFTVLLDQKVKAGEGEKKFNIQSVSTDVAVSNPQTARLTLARSMEADLGRKPTNAEIAQFASYLANQQRANPETTVTSYDLHSTLNSASSGNQVVNTGSRTTSGGVEPEAAAESFVMDNNGGEMAQTATDRVYQVFLKMLGGQVSLS